MYQRSPPGLLTPVWTRPSERSCWRLWKFLKISSSAIPPRRDQRPPEWYFAADGSGISLSRYPSENRICHVAPAGVPGEPDECSICCFGFRCDDSRTGLHGCSRRPGPRDGRILIHPPFPSPPYEQESGQKAATRTRSLFSVAHPRAQLPGAPRFLRNSV